MRATLCFEFTAVAMLHSSYLHYSTQLFLNPLASSYCFDSIFRFRIYFTASLVLATNLKKVSTVILFELYKHY